MATNISGLFGDITKTPQQYQQEALQGLVVSPAQMGQQGLYQQLVSQMSNAGANIGMGVGGLLGGKTAEQVRGGQINAAMQEVSQGQYATEWEKLDALAKNLAEKGMNAEAEKAADRSMKLRSDAMSMKKQQYELTSFENDKKAQEAIASLPADASSEDIMKAIRPFASSSTIYKGVLDKEQSIANKAAKLEELKLRHEQRMQEIASQNASREQIAAMNAEFRNMMAQQTLALRQEQLALRRDALNSKNGTLPATLQKAEQGDLEQYDSRTLEIGEMEKAMTALKGGENEKPLELGPIANKLYEARNATGNASPESIRYAAVQSAYKAAVNTKVSAEKGVQTDKDVLRFAEQLVTAYSNNDYDALKGATERYLGALATNKETLKKRIQGRRKNAGTPFYDFSIQDEQQTDTPSTPTPTKRFVPGQGLVTIGG